MRTEGDVTTYRALVDDPVGWAMMYGAYRNPLDDDLARALIQFSAASNHH
jgi:hypothetical protein